MPRKIRADGSFWIWLAFVALTLPLKWVMAAVAAAAIHELGHLIVLSILSVSVPVLRLRAGGAVLDTGPMEPKEELVCALAGPAASFMLLLFLRIFPRTALCAMVQGCFNLLPLGCLDGARVWKCVFCLLNEKALANREK